IGRVRYHARATGISADVVALDGVAKREVERRISRVPAVNLYSEAGVAADDISGRGRRPADGIVRTGNDDALLPAQRCGPGDVGADVIALYEIVLGATGSHGLETDAAIGVARNNVSGPGRGAANDVVVTPNLDPRMNPRAIAESSQT